MSSARRTAYLKTLGIDLWLPRRSVGAVSVAPVNIEATAVSPGRSPTGSGAGSSSTASALPSASTNGVPSASAPAPLTSPEAARSPQPPAFTDQPVSALAPDLAAWNALKAEVANCTKCALHATRTQGVLGVGNMQARWMVIGEAPGADEDRLGEPFVGRAGKLLDAMLRAVGLDRGRNVYIANILKSRPPNNRDPRPDEVVACLPYLKRQIALIKPLLILAVGRIAAQNLLGTDESLGRLRGRVHHFGELNTPLIVTYHPAYLLRTPADKRKAWEDLKFARSLFRQLA